MQITIKIINQAPPAAEIDPVCCAGQNTEPLIQLTAEAWRSRQAA